MGSVWSFRIPEKDFKEETWWTLKESSQKILEQYDSTFSSWRKDSESEKISVLLRGKKITRSDLPKNTSVLFLEGYDFAEEARRMTKGAFDIRSPKGLDFGGITKGHVLGELAVEFLRRGYEDFLIDGGGGNQVFSGKFRPEGRTAGEGLLFRSASRSLQHNKQHIFDRANPHRRIEEEVVIYCLTRLNKNNLTATTRADVDQTKLVGSLSDALSTALLVERQNWTLPKFCQEALAQEVKFL